MSTGAGKLRWGLLATGAIEAPIADAIRASDTSRLAAVAAEEARQARALADAHGIPRAYGRYEDLLADSAIDIVYISVPHPLHAEWAIKAAEAGKHILCEKPLALNYAEAMAIIEAARQNGVFLMEAYMYRVHPQTQRIVELLSEGVIGQIRVITVVYNSATEGSSQSRLVEHDLGGGGILYGGGYCSSLARLVAAIVTSNYPTEPSEIAGLGYIDPDDRVDHFASGLLRFEGDVYANLSCGVRLRQHSGIWIYGDEGDLHVPRPCWQSSLPGHPIADASEIVLTRRGGKSEIIKIVADKPLHVYGVDHVAAHIGEKQSPVLTWEDSLKNMRTLDRWREAIGLVFDREQPTALTLTVAKRPLRRPGERADIPHMRLKSHDMEASRLVLGVIGQGTAARSAVLFDNFFERGGNFFDTAWGYEDGLAEQRVGWWLSTRGVREEVVILDKGAETPDCYPEALSRQHHESLERLCTDYVDLYMLHRDNPDIPVGEFIEVLNEHQRTGTMRSFGASNWSIERIREANEYAAANGLEGFSAVSNQFSLARMEIPLWDGTLDAFGPEWRAWLESERIPLIPWSSQARGFFVDQNEVFVRADWGDRYPMEVDRHWGSEANYGRRARAGLLARRRGVRPITIALAYVLCQPFPTFPIIGPRTLSQLNESVQAFDVDLSPSEVAWLLHGRTTDLPPG